MTNALINILQALAGLVAGGLIGAGFGVVQTAARTRNEQLRTAGKLNTGWAVMPGSGKRVAGLVVVLALIQLICPALFHSGVEWWVSGGVAAGYGWTLYRELRRRQRAQNF